jgi:hypothetical protein
MFTSRFLTPRQQWLRLWYWKAKNKKIFFVQLPIAQSLLITRQNEIN